MRRWLPLLMLVCLGCGHVSKVARPRQYGLPVTLAKLADPRIDESSGIAPSHLYPGKYYTHNDSGDSPRFFRFAPRGGPIDEIHVRNAKNVDWEDMASSVVDGVPYLFLGDIGDNLGRRKSITVYRVPEPGDGESTIAADRRFELHYPDEPHNAETLLVHPKTGDIYVVTKAANRPSMIFKLPCPARSGTYTLTKIGEIKVGGFIRESRTVTGGAVSPDGRFVVLRTYMSAYEYAVPEGDFDGWVRVTPSPIKTNTDAQGEGITYSLDGRTLVTTSEGIPCQVSEIPIR